MKNWEEMKVIFSEHFQNTVWNSAFLKKSQHSEDDKGASATHNYRGWVPRTTLKT